MTKKKKAKVFVYKLVQGVKSGKPVASFWNRRDAVYWCKVNQISPLPDGEWEDDYFIKETSDEQT